MAHALEYGLRPQGVGKQLKEASRVGARMAVILGPDEIARGTATVRDLASGTERSIPLQELAEEGD